MTYIHYISLNYVIIYLAVICAGLSLWQYKKTKGTMPLLSAIAWLLAAGLSALGLWALE